MIYTQTDADSRIMFGATCRNTKYNFTVFCIWDRFYVLYIYIYANATFTCSSSFFPYSTPVSEVYMVKSFVTPVVLISPIGSLQPGSERSLKEEEGGAPRYRGISESTKYTATNPPASKHRDSLILYFSSSRPLPSSALNLVGLSLNESNRRLFLPTIRDFLIRGIRRIVAYHRGYDWLADNTSDTAAVWSREIATVRTTPSAREVVKEDGEEDSGCLVYTQGRKAS